MKIKEEQLKKIQDHNKKQLNNSIMHEVGVLEAQISTGYLHEVCWESIKRLKSVKSELENQSTEQLTSTWKTGRVY